jgi:putative membrane protein
MNLSSSPAPDYKKFQLAVNVLAIALPIIVAILFGVRLDIQLPFNVYLLPMINAVLNGGSAVLLLAALWAVKQGNIQAHTRLIYAAMALSILFLVCYVLYHVTTNPTTYGGVGAMRTLYFVLLVTHIILAIIQPALVLYAFMYAYTGQIEKHKRIVKLSFPVWLYVSVTGVICYLMIAPYYPN